MSAVDKEARASREETILRIRRGIRAAQLRVTLDEIQGRQTPEHQYAFLARPTIVRVFCPVHGSYLLVERAQIESALSSPGH
jgi:hypothetical protein